MREDGLIPARRSWLVLQEEMLGGQEGVGRKWRLKCRLWKPLSLALALHRAPSVPGLVGPDMVSGLTVPWKN